MSYIKTLMNGEQSIFNPRKLTPMQRITLRFVVVGVLYYGLAAIEGMIMRIYQIEPITFLGSDHYFAILTAHPLVGIFGSTYLIVFGAFLFVVPFMMKKPLWSIKLANATFWLITIGTFVFWFSGFLTHYAPLYTLYWPLPADFNQFDPLSGAFFITGIAIVMLGAVFFVINIFKTIAYTPEG